MALEPQLFFTLINRMEKNVISRDLNYGMAVAARLTGY